MNGYRRLRTLNPAQDVKVILGGSAMNEFTFFADTDLPEDADFLDRIVQDCAGLLQKESKK